MSRIRSKVASDGYVYDDMSRIRGKIESASLRVDQRYSCSYRHWYSWEQARLKNSHFCSIIDDETVAAPHRHR
jgi:hypothetical protein